MENGVSELLGRCIKKMNCEGILEECIERVY